MTGPFRGKGGLIDRDRRLIFRFNDRVMQGHPGDTLASALLANGQRLAGRSFKYHRPRGIFSAGSEEPNALVLLGEEARCDPNTRATMAELYDGLAATSQNHRGSLEWDLLAVNDLLAPFLGAGFYYKTFMWPARFWEKLYEPLIRSAAGLGRLSGKPDPDQYDHGYLHCDLLVIGAGPAGLTAARAAAASGARVIVADEDFLPGGRLNAETHSVDDRRGCDWAADTWAALAQHENVRRMPRTTVFGVYDHGTYGALERHTDHLADKGSGPRQTLWRIYARRSLLCAGATERSLAFANNDRPGVMLAGAVRAYANRFGIVAGRRIVLMTNNDDGLRTVADLESSGADVIRIDTRDGKAVADTSGRKGLRAVRLTDGGRLKADCLAVAGGWNPNVHLTCHHRGRPVWRDDIAAFVPGADLPPGMTVAGAANGTMTMDAILNEAHGKALDAVSALGFARPDLAPPRGHDEAAALVPLWHVPGRKRAWVDLQNDVTAKDVRQSHAEGFRSVEHLKRYTTLGMATDQGRTSNVLGLAILAEAASKTIPDTGTTIFRPPYTPVPIAAFAGHARGKQFRPTRLAPSHDWAKAHGASFTEAGHWLRAEWYARPGEAGWRDSVDREVTTVRTAVGFCDVSTLGKIDIQGRDAAAFLNRIYANGFAKLPVGRVRYGLMLREDGFAYDDGTAARLSETQFLMTTTTANAGLVMRNLEFARQGLWPDLDVHLTSVTDAWAQFSVAGPKARELLSRLVDLDLSNDAFPFMACAACTVRGVAGRLFRISFSGELAYEVAVPARYGAALAEALMTAGADLGVAPYGTEALSVLRIEKGHVAGNELNGQTTAAQLGLSRMVSHSKDAIGTVMSQRPAIAGDDNRLMGFRPVDRTATLNAGAHFVSRGDPADTAHDQGWMTSVAFSPTLGHSIGLGFLKHGEQRIGEILRAYDPVRGKDTEVEVVSPHFIDPEGVRQRG